MGEENISQEFRSKYISKTKTCLIKAIDQNELMSQKHKKVSTILNYINPNKAGFLKVVYSGDGAI